MQANFDAGEGGSALRSGAWTDIYDELRAIAAAQLRREGSGHTLQATALANEAYVRLVRRTELVGESRNHLLAAAALTIRRILVDHARHKRRLARVAGQTPELALDAPEEAPVDWVALDEALTALAKLHERQARIVELKHFGGLTVDQCARVLGVSARTIDAEWAAARAWLARALRRERSA
jgi:RNA polymerase sigma factor (TIGR02999 family)